MLSDVHLQCSCNTFTFSVIYALPGEGRKAQPRATIFDRRTLQSSPESGDRAAYDG
jgi:hypothetical protein